MDTSIFLSILFEESLKRRTAKALANGQEYFEKILEPMHKRYVSPSKKWANHLIQIQDKTKEQVLEEVERILKPMIK